MASVVAVMGTTIALVGNAGVRVSGSDVAEESLRTDSPPSSVARHGSKPPATLMIGMSNLICVLHDNPRSPSDQVIPPSR